MQRLQPVDEERAQLAESSEALQVRSGQLRYLRQGVLECVLAAEPQEVCPLERSDVRVLVLCQAVQAAASIEGWLRFRRLSAGIKLTGL